MTWTTMKGGDYPGKTLPQILFLDPDWFFKTMERCGFAYDGALMLNAQDLIKKARSIRIPRDGNPDVEYEIDPNTGTFCGVYIVPATDDMNGGSTRTLRSKVIDMSIPYRIKHGDKQGNRMFLSGLKKILFGNFSERMTKVKCEEFFDNPKNFQ